MSYGELGTPILRLSGSDVKRRERESGTGRYAASTFPQLPQYRAPVSVTGAPHAPHWPARYRPQLEQ